MSIKSFLKEILGIKRKDKGKTILEPEPIKNYQQKSTEINSYNLVGNRLSSPIITNNQQKSTEKFNQRDIQYARRIGQIEQMSLDISDIKEKLTGLDVKFDLRVPDKVLTEEKFKKELDESVDIFRELEKIKEAINKLGKTITSSQQLSPIITTLPPKKEEVSTKEDEILRHLTVDKLSAEVLGKKINLSRSRTNQILLEMQNKGLVSRIKYGKKYLWSSNKRSK